MYLSIYYIESSVLGLRRNTTEGIMIQNLASKTLLNTVKIILNTKTGDLKINCIINLRCFSISSMCEKEMFNRKVLETLID